MIAYYYHCKITAERLQAIWPGTTAVFTTPKGNCLAFHRDEKGQLRSVLP